METGSRSDSPNVASSSCVRPTSRFLFFPSLKENHTFVFSSTGSPLLTGAGRIRNHPVVWVSRVQRVPGAPWERGARPDLSGVGGRAGSVGAPCQMASGRSEQMLSPKGIKAPESSEGISGRDGIGALRKHMAGGGGRSLQIPSPAWVSELPASRTGFWRLPGTSTQEVGLPGARTPERGLPEVLLHVRVVKSHSAS